MAEQISIELEPGLRIAWRLEDVRRGLSGGDPPALWSIDSGLGSRHSALRVLTAVTAPGTMLLLTALRPDGAGGHDVESPRAALIDGSGELTEVEEALVSTQYAADGTIARLGLELYREGEDFPLRGAGDAVESVSTDRGEYRHHEARLDFRLDGESGNAVYEILER